jgi:hypothetical protein
MFRINIFKKQHTKKTEFDDCIYEDTVKYTDGSSYTGSWLQDQQHGYGVYTDVASGYIYKGNWDYGIMTGKGKMICKSNNSVYKGMFLEGYYHGNGIIYVKKKTI